MLGKSVLTTLRASLGFEEKLVGLAAVGRRRLKRRSKCIERICGGWKDGWAWSWLTRPGACRRDSRSGRLEERSGMRRGAGGGSGRGRTGARVSGQGGRVDGQWVKFVKQVLHLVVRLWLWLWLLEKCWWRSTSDTVSVYTELSQVSTHVSSLLLIFKPTTMSSL